MKITDTKHYIPYPDELQTGELAYNTVDDSLSLKIDNDKVIPIMQSNGTNSNGIWTNLPDGTMIQRGIVDLEFNNHNWTSDKIIYFPSEFVNNDYIVTVSIEESDGFTGHNPIQRFIRHKKNESVEIYYGVDNYDSITGTITVAYIAIGRWK